MTKLWKDKKNLLAVGWILFAVVARLIPHPPNVTPMNSMALFGGAKLPRALALAITLGALVCSDVLLAWLHGHSVFGWWSLFTYSGFALLVLAGSKLGSSPTGLRLGGFLAGGSLFFWLWTNFGVWLSSAHGMYPQTLAGLVQCYVQALPFLGYSLLGDLAWGAVFFYGFSQANYWLVERRQIEA
jgi:hypothetical protein